MVAVTPTARHGAPSGEAVVASVVSTVDMVTERVCVEQDGQYVLEADAEGANLASGDTGARRRDR